MYESSKMNFSVNNLFTISDGSVLTYINEMEFLLHCMTLKNRQPNT